MQQHSHTPIIPEETWELVQLEMERRRRMGSRFSAKGPLASRLVCGDCGAFFGSKVWHSTDPYKTVVWRCNDKYRPNAKRISRGEKCVTGHVTEEEVYQAFSTIVQKLIAQRPEVVAACEAVLADLLNGAKEPNMKTALQKLRRAYPNLEDHPFPDFGHGEIMAHPKLMAKEIDRFMEREG